MTDANCSCFSSYIFALSFPKSPSSLHDLPLNIYMVIFGTGIFVFVLSLIFCCYFISKLRHQAQSERFGYKEVKSMVVFCTYPQRFGAEWEVGDVPPPVFLPRRCLVKWLEVRCVCPMCNKPMAGPAQPRAGIGTLLDELV
uniref:Ring finger protein 122 n=1 Tax=Buteo japonicus TaxID=224669 RepID=A0A8C0AQV3_9AVES